MIFIKRFNLASSVTLSVLIFLIGVASAQDSFEDFTAAVEKPYADSVSSYQLKFSLSGNTYRRLNNARIKFEFPDGFSLGSVDSVNFESNHLTRKYAVDRITVGEETDLEIRLDRISGGDGNESGSQRIDVGVTIYRIVNPADSGAYRIRATARKGEDRLAGPSWSEYFHIIEFETSPGNGGPGINFIVENNPFNPNNGPVRFVYNLQSASDVEFNIFTVTGEEAYSHTYLSGAEGGKSGTNQIQWDGRNSEGEMVLNGVYVTMLNVISTGEKASLKLAVLK